MLIKLSRAVFGEVFGCAEMNLLKRSFIFRRCNVHYWHRIPRKFYSAIGASACHLKVLGTGSSEIAPSLCLSTDLGSYLFNCPERLMCALSEFHCKSASLKHIFVTKSSWENIGGLIGASIALKKIHGVSFSVTGPNDLLQFQKFAKAFKNNIDDIIKVNPVTRGCGQPAILQFNDLIVKPVELQSSQMTLRKSNSVVAYVIQLPTIRGNLDSKKAKELKLVPRNDFKTLIDGYSVTNCDGTIVHPSHVIGPDRIGPQILVLECPTLDFVQSLTSHCQLKMPNLKPVVIVHITPKLVFEDKLYQQWMKHFSNCQHIFLHSNFCPSEMHMTSYLQYPILLHLVDPNVFHLPTTVSKRTTQCAANKSMIIGQNSLQFHIRPSSKFGVQGITLPNRRHSSIDKALKKLSELVKDHPILKSNYDVLLSKTRRTLLNDYHMDHTSSSKALVTFLGTGAAIPTKYRNVSAILIHLPTREYILLDAGEGTLGQLYKCLGPHCADKVLRNLKCIFISHLHCDHHLGIISILKKREELIGSSKSDDLTIIGPSVLNYWLQNYSNVYESLRFNFFASKKQQALTLSDLPIEIITVPVIHSSFSHGVVLKYKDEWKLVYSGDTRPCHNLISAGKGASLLIHEATFAHESLDDAIANKHSTKVEALKVAHKMNAAFVILTHFSQRYNETPSSDLFQNLPSNAAIAFDFMTVDINNLERLHEISQVMCGIHY